jgi:hypothetical protein
MALALPLPSDPRYGSGGLVPTILTFIEVVHEWLAAARTIIAAIQQSA